MLPQELLNQRQVLTADKHIWQAAYLTLHGDATMYIGIRRLVSLHSILQEDMLCTLSLKAQSSCKSCSRKITPTFSSLALLRFFSSCIQDKDWALHLALKPCSALWRIASSFAMTTRLQDWIFSRSDQKMLKCVYYTQSSTALVTDAFVRHGYDWDRVG